MAGKTKTTKDRLLKEFEEKAENWLFGFMSSDGEEYNQYLSECDEDTWKEIKQFLSKALDSIREETLRKILENGHGGGNWRRLIFQQIANLKTKGGI